MSWCHLCACQEFNFQMCMRTNKLLTFSRPCFEFISKRTVISTTFPIQFYLTLVSQSWNVSFRLVEFSLQTDERARHGQKTAPLTCQRYVEQKTWWAILWGILSVVGYRESWKTTSYQIFPIPAHDMHPGHTTPPLFSTARCMAKDTSNMMVFVKAACSQFRILHHFPLCPSLILLLTAFLT